MDLETAILLGKGTKSSASAALVEDVLNSPLIYSFSTLMNLPSLKSLSISHPLHWNSLNLFSYGCLNDYSQDTHLPLTPASMLKLRILSLVSACCKDKRVQYGPVMQALKLESVREMEDVVIAAMELDLVVAKLDQKRACIVVTLCKSRDIQPSDIPQLVNAFSNWHNVISDLLKRIYDSSAAAENEFAALELQDREWKERVKELSSVFNSSEGGHGGMGMQMGMQMQMGMHKKGKRPLGGDFQAASSRRR